MAGEGVSFTAKGRGTVGPTSETTTDTRGRGRRGPYDEEEGGWFPEGGVIQAVHVDEQELDTGEATIPSSSLSSLAATRLCSGRRA
jgi:hypothetical protein